VFAVADGGLYQRTDRAAVSAGYVFNENPIRHVGTLFSVQSPLAAQMRKMLRKWLRAWKSPLWKNRNRSFAW
jgi:hypothetical protein